MIEKLLQIQRKAIIYRGEVLHRMTILEKLIDNYIIFYLTNKDIVKVHEMQLLIFGDNRMTLENKRQIFQYIAEHHDLIWYKNYQSIIFIKKKPNSLNKDLVYVIEQRNVFAHCLLNTDGLEEMKTIDKVQFLRFKNEAEIIQHDDKSLQELIGTIDNLTTYISGRNKN